MLKIRLMRIGAKKRPFYRVVAVDERNKRTGGYIELLGTYNPLTEPKDIKLKQDRIDYWVKQGAQMSTGFLRIIGKAPQRPPRKPKKEKKESSDVSLQTSDKKEEKTEEAAPEQPTPEQPAEAPAAEEVKTEEKSLEETTVETSAEPVIPNGSEESLANASQNESGDSSAAPQNDKVKKGGSKDEGSA